MKIYSIQKDTVLQDIEDKGYYRPNPEWTGNDYFSIYLSYRWMIDRLYEHSGLPLDIPANVFKELQAQDDEFLYSVKQLDNQSYTLNHISSMPHPIWAWQKQYGKKDGRPHMNSWNTCVPEKVVRLTLDIPKERILFSDFDLWHYPLNLWRLPKDLVYQEIYGKLSHRDEIQEEKQKAYGRSIFSDSRLVSKVENPTLFSIQQEILSSWTRCLISYNRLGSPSNPVVAPDGRPWIERTTQGVFWEILSEDIVKIEYFTTHPH